MEKLGSVLSQARGLEAHSIDLAADEIAQLNIPHTRTPPPHVACSYCGTILHHRGLVIGGRVVLWSPSPMRCDCAPAKEYWHAIDAHSLLSRQKQNKTSASLLRDKKQNLYLSDTGIKKRFATRTFANYRIETTMQKQAWEAAKEYADNFHCFYEKGEGLYIEGTNGTGKTHLAAAIALHLLEKGRSVICQTSIDLLNNIKLQFNAKNTESNNEHKILSAYASADLLILDDLGKEQSTDWSIAVLYSIINERYEDMLPVIITTNYNEHNLIKRLTPQGCGPTRAVAILSRLKEMSSVLTMAWEDYRQHRPIAK
jgi:DNA replication protein DnaC